MKKQLKKFQQQLNADSIKRRDDWLGYAVYEPIYKREMVIGFPKFILEKDGNFRYATGEEVFVLLKYVRKLA